MMNLLEWPKAASAGQCLYIAEQLDEATLLSLVAKGWVVIDVRTMPNSTDADRAASLRCWLEGLRVGTITVSKDRYKFVELEARTLGVLNTKTASDGKRNQEQELDPLEALNFKSARAFKGTYLDGAAGKTSGRPAGRPRSVLKPGANSPARGKPNVLSVVPDEPAGGDDDLDR
jgi:hypothetical protein